MWLECRSFNFNCTEPGYYSSPGLYGAYPFVNPSLNFFGLLARQGAATSWPKGIAVIDAVRDDLERWAACDNP